MVGLPKMPDLDKAMGVMAKQSALQKSQFIKQLTALSLEKGLTAKEVVGRYLEVKEEFEKIKEE